MLSIEFISLYKTAFSSYSISLTLLSNNRYYVGRYEVKFTRGINDVVDYIIV